MTASAFDASPVRGVGDELSWTEDFADDPVSAGRFSVPAGHSAARFSYDAGGPFVTVHYDTLLPTAWYVRPIDPAGARVLGRYDDFEFTVTFRVRSAGFWADPDGFAQIAWGLLNAQTTGWDRAGGSLNGPYAFDCVAFDYFPNVSPLYGGPTLGPTLIHSDDGTPYFWNIDFTFGPETTIDPLLGDETILLDAVHIARLVYDGANQVATLTVQEAARSVEINADGAGGPGGFDGDVATIQTFVLIDSPFVLDAFALTAWEDTYILSGVASVIADVDVYRIEFFAPAVLVGDMNRDGRVDGLDTAGFVELMLTAAPDPSLAARGDFTGDGIVDQVDLGAFVQVLLQP